ncbi:hypothetical protein [Sphingomonas sp. So64.6b]|uniref:hypothetical protein n=1 Tax=Sphingomonas sp. So64.6b TaxID=2997354 RepID=UPI0016032073|nr:hypothetical protein [Sphingomonas sp. So64.6b]
MKTPDAPSKQLTRAYRLSKEASNCLTIAIGSRSTADAAELIDEAIKLATRAHELRQCA